MLQLATSTSILIHAYVPKELSRLGHLVIGLQGMRTSIAMIMRSDVQSSLLVLITSILREGRGTLHK